MSPRTRSQRRVLPHQQRVLRHLAQMLLHDGLQHGGDAMRGLPLGFDRKPAGGDFAVEQAHQVGVAARAVRVRDQEARERIVELEHAAMLIGHQQAGGGLAAGEG